jgi:hypothetical protein
MSEIEYELPQDESSEEIEEAQFPEELAILPLRGVVVYPHFPGPERRAGPFNTVGGRRHRG